MTVKYRVGDVAKDLGVDWDKAYHEREQIKKLWSEKVTQ
jgi:hypothetical protein